MKQKSFVCGSRSSTSSRSEIHDGGGCTLSEDEMVGLDVNTLDFGKVRFKIPEFSTHRRASLCARGVRAAAVEGVSAA